MLSGTLQIQDPFILLISNIIYQDQHNKETQWKRFAFGKI